MTALMNQPEQMEAPAISFWQSRAGAFALAADDENSFYSQRARLTADLICTHCSPSIMLDVGCGPGQLSYELAVRGFDVYGTDISEDMLNMAAERTASVLAESESRFRMTQGRTAPFPWRFDLIVALGVFPYVHDYEEYVDYLSEQLEQQGYLIASCINRASLGTLELLRQHVLKFKCNRAWWQVLIHLVRTGLWSGGFVDYKASRQNYSSAQFDELLQRRGFELIQAFDLYNLGYVRLDARALHRSHLDKWLALHLGWCHVGMFRKVQFEAKN